MNFKAGSKKEPWCLWNCVLSFWFVHICEFLQGRANCLYYILKIFQIQKEVRITDLADFFFLSIRASSWRNDKIYWTITNLAYCFLKSLFKPSYNTKYYTHILNMYHFYLSMMPQQSWEKKERTLFLVWSWEDMIKFLGVSLMAIMFI